MAHQHHDELRGEYRLSNMLVKERATVLFGGPGPAPFAYGQQMAAHQTGPANAMGTMTPGPPTGLLGMGPGMFSPMETPARTLLVNHNESAQCLTVVYTREHGTAFTK